MRWKLLAKIRTPKPVLLFEKLLRGSEVGERWGGIRNKSGRDFCPLAQSIISAWKTYGKGSYIFFLLLRPVKKVGYAFFRDHKVFKVLLVIFKKFPRHLNRSAVIIIKLTMPSYFTYRVPFESKKSNTIYYNSKNGFLSMIYKLLYKILSLLP